MVCNGLLFLCNRRIRTGAVDFFIGISQEPNLNVVFYCAIFILYLSHLLNILYNTVNKSILVVSLRFPIFIHTSSYMGGFLANSCNLPPAIMSPSMSHVTTWSIVAGMLGLSQCVLKICNALIRKNLRALRDRNRGALRVVAFVWEEDGGEENCS